MSKQTEQELKDQIKKLQEALEVVQGQDTLPLAFMAEFNGNPRLCLRATDKIVALVKEGVGYVTIDSKGNIGSFKNNTRFIKDYYKITEVIFE